MRYRRRAYYFLVNYVVFLLVIIVLNVNATETFAATEARAVSRPNDSRPNSSLLRKQFRQDFSFVKDLHMEKLSARVVDGLPRLANKNRQRQGYIILLESRFIDQSIKASQALIADRKLRRKSRRDQRKSGLLELKESIKFSAPGLRERKQFNYLPLMHVEITDRQTLAELISHDGVRSVVVDEVLYKDVNQSLPLISQPQAQAQGYTGAATTVAVVDTGLDYTNPAFGCSSSGVPASCQVKAMVEFAPEDNALDADGHGTAVSAIVAATASEVGLIGVDVFDGSTALSSDILMAIDWIITNRDVYGISTVNFSLGGDTNFTEPCDSAFNPFFFPFNDLIANEILPVVSAGNDGFIDGLSSPACLSNALSVGAVYDANVGEIVWNGCTDMTSAADQVACFSNSATFLDMLAPGAIIDAAGSTVGGTSMSAPFVAATAGIIASQFGLGVNAIKARLLNSAVMVTDMRNGLTHPRLLLPDSLFPLGDDFSDAIVVDSLSENINGSTVFATTEVGESSGMPGVWFEFQNQVAPSLTFVLNSSEPNQILSIYSGTSLTDLVLRDEGLTGELLTIPMQAEEVFFISVATSSGGATFQLSWSPEVDNEEIPLLPWWGIPLLVVGLLASNIRQRLAS